MGDGILMARKAGAASEGLGTLLSMGPFYTGSLQGGIVSVEANTVWVNKRGDRFADESTHIASESANALDRQPETRFLLRFLTRRSSGVLWMTELSGATIGPIHPVRRMVDIDKYLKKDMQEGHVKVGNTWKAIAEWIGADPERLNASRLKYTIMRAIAGLMIFSTKIEDISSPLETRRTMLRYATRLFTGRPAESR